MVKKLIILFLLAFIIRLLAVNQSLWLDEATSANIATNYNLLSIVTQFSPADFHPPLYYLFLHCWVLVFGSSVVALRLPSIIFSLITGLFVYRIVLIKKSSSVAFWATTLYLFNPLVVYYSQEVRMYSLITLLITASLYAHLRQQHFLFNLLTILSLTTFYGSIFFYLSLYLYLLLTKRHLGLFKILPSFILALIILSPLLIHQYQNSRLQLLNVSHWSLVLGNSNLKNLLLIPLKFFFGRISFYPKIVYYLISGIWAFYCSLVVLQNHKNRFYLFMIICPLMLAFIVSFNSPMLQYFRYLYLLPLISILIASSSNLNRYLLALGFTVLSLVYLTTPSFHREDWQTLSAFLPSDTPILIISSFSDPLIYYRHDLRLYDLRSPLNLAKDYYVIPYGTEIYGFDYSSALLSNGLVKEKTISFRQLSLEHWTKKQDVR